MNLAHTVLRDALDAKGFAEFTVRGESMYPLLRPGMTIRVVRCAEKDLRVGDIIIFRSRDDLLAHRIVAKHGSSLWIAKGDNTFISDDPVAFEEILGRVIAVAGEEYIYGSRDVMLARLSHRQGRIVSELRSRSERRRSSTGRRVKRENVLAWPLRLALRPYLWLVRLIAAGHPNRDGGRLPMDDTVDIHPGTLQMVRRRAAVAGRPATDLSWVAVDPLIGFLGDALRTSPPRPERLAKYMQTWNAAVRALRCLADANIQTIIFKGLVFAEELYDSPLHRPMRDVDLLVRPDDFAAACRCLSAAGFMIHDDFPERRPHAVSDAEVFPADAWAPGELTFVDERGVEIDLHWHLIPEHWLRPCRNILLDEVWRDARPFQFEGGSVWTMSDVHTAAYLTLNLSRNAYRSLFAYLDLDRLWRRQGRDFAQEFFDTCRRWRIRIAADYALRYLKYLCDTPVQISRRLRLRPGLPRPVRLLKDSRRWRSDGYMYFVQLATLDRLRDALGVIVRLVLPPRGWLRRRYGERASFVHHWRHVFRALTERRTNSGNADGTDGTR